VRLHRLPARLYPTLRRLRTVGLWAIEPVDVCHKALTGQRHLPPLWLRRHVGPVASFERGAAEIAAAIALLGVLRPEHHVLDAGCGAGAMTFEFQRMLSASGRYVGFDVHRAAIEWCRRQFAGDERFRFELAEVRTSYSREFVAPARAYRFPARDGEIDFVLAKSLFTHMLEPDAEHYLREISRVLATSGRALLSAFLLEDPEKDGVRPDRTLQFRYGAGSVRWLTDANPTSGVAYARARFLEMVNAAGLHVERVIEGYWRATIAPNLQDLLILAHASR